VLKISCIQSKHSEYFLSLLPTKQAVSKINFCKGSSIS